MGSLSADWGELFLEKFLNVSVQKSDFQSYWDFPENHPQSAAWSRHLWLPLGGQTRKETPALFSPVHPWAVPVCTPSAASLALFSRGKKQFIFIHSLSFSFPLPSPLSLFSFSPEWKCSRAIRVALQFAGRDLEIATTSHRVFQTTLSPAPRIPLVHSLPPL